MSQQQRTIKRAAQAGLDNRCPVIKRAEKIVKIAERIGIPLPEQSVN